MLNNLGVRGAVGVTVAAAVVLAVTVSAVTGAGRDEESAETEFTVLAIDELDTLDSLARQTLSVVADDHPGWYASQPVALRVRAGENGRIATYVAVANGISVGDQVVTMTRWEQLVQMTEGSVRKSEVHFVDRLVATG